jgi:hypothetical protein
VFGKGFMPVNEGGGFMADQRRPDLSTALPGVTVNQPRGLFGRMGGASNAERLGLFAAGISDAVDPLTMHPTGGGSMAAMLKQRKDDAAKRAQQEAFAASYDPVTGKFDTGKFIAITAKAGGDLPDSVMAAAMKPEDPLLADRQNLLQAQIADYEARSAGREETEMDRREQQARIASLEALAGQRTAQQGLIGVKTRQPDAPQRARASGGVVKANPNSVSWD